MDAQTYSPVSETSFYSDEEIDEFLEKLFMLNFDQQMEEEAAVMGPIFNLTENHEDKRSHPRKGKWCGGKKNKNAMNPVMAEEQPHFPTGNEPAKPVRSLVPKHLKAHLKDRVKR